MSELLERVDKWQRDICGLDETTKKVWSDKFDCVYCNNLLSSLLYLRRWVCMRSRQHVYLMYCYTRLRIDTQHFCYQIRLVLRHGRCHCPQFSAPFSSNRSPYKYLRYGSGWISRFFGSKVFVTKHTCATIEMPPEMQHVRTTLWIWTVSSKRISCVSIQRYQIQYLAFYLRSIINVSHRLRNRVNMNMSIGSLVDHERSFQNNFWIRICYIMGFEFNTPDTKET